MQTRISAGPHNVEKVRTTYKLVFGLTAGISLPVGVGSDNAVVYTSGGNTETARSSHRLNGLYARGFGAGAGFFASFSYGSLFMGSGAGYLSNVLFSSDPFLGSTLFLPNWVNFGAGFDFLTIGISLPFGDLADVPIPP